MVSKKVIPPAPTLEPVKFLNESQKLAYETIDKNKIVFLLGPAGTSKSHIATAYGVRAVQTGRYDQLVLTRPLVESGEEMGFQAGDFHTKLQPYNAPVLKIMKKLGASIDVEQLPLAFMRGHTLENCVSILDEAQNCSFKLLKLYLSRKGRNSKLIITGDSSQSDIEGRRPEDRSGLERVVAMLEGIPGIAVFSFTAADNVRDPLVKVMMERFEAVEQETMSGVW